MWRNVTLVKIGARIVRHGRYVVFQLAELAVPGALFTAILRRIKAVRSARSAKKDPDLLGVRVGGPPPAPRPRRAATPTQP